MQESLPPVLSIKHELLLSTSSPHHAVPKEEEQKRKEEQKAKEVKANAAKEKPKDVDWNKDGEGEDGTGDATVNHFWAVVLHISLTQSTPPSSINSVVFQ